MKIKKFSESNKKEKIEQQDVLFNSKSLVKDKDEKPSIKNSIEDQEKLDKEFRKELDKVQKFESFISDTNISDDFGTPTDEYEIETHASDELRGDNFLEDDIDAEYEESETSGCGCCSDCTGEEDCYCGCEDCRCGESEIIRKASDFVDNIVSEKLKWHLENNKPITENIFRPGSQEFFNIIKEARELFDEGKIELCDIDREIYESTQIGKFAWFNGELVPLDLPMENIIELNEAEYKGKKVKLNYPMRNTGSGKKYYVYVMNPKTDKVKKVSFGDVKGGLTAKVSNAEARRNFASRHQCSTKKDKTKAGYWACRINRYGHLWGGKTYPGYW